MQERQVSESHSEALAPTERRALQRARAHRAQGLTAAVGGAVLALFALGCPQPADLQDPKGFPPPAVGGASSTGGSGTGGAVPSACEVSCIKDIFQKQPALCKLCHTTKTTADGGLQSSGLNLEADGFTDRLKNVAAKHTDLPMGKDTCTPGDKLIDTATPANSWLLKKIHGEQGNCGDPMPSTGTLSAAQKTCIEMYVACVAPGGAAPGGTAGAAAGGSAGAAAGATAGAATGGSAGAATGGAAGAGGTGGNGGTGGT